MVPGGLGLKQGDTENSEVCVDLLQSLIERGLPASSSLLFTIDGSKALRKALLKVFGREVPVQRCVRHKERNILGYLPKVRSQEFRRRWRKLHGNVSFDRAGRELKSLGKWLESINLEALNSLEEAGEETLTVIKLKCPGLLRKTLLSTNPVESAFSIVRQKSSRVKNWKSGRGQVSRWAAVALKEAEKSFRTVKGFREIPLFLQELEKYSQKSSCEKRRKAAV